MDKKSKNYAKAIILPALVIGTFCALAIFTSHKLVQMDRNLLQLYNKKNIEIDGQISTQIGPSESDFMRNYEQKIMTQEHWLYASIAVLGIVGFLLAFANAIKAKQVENSNRDHEETNRTLESRLAAMELILHGIFIVNKEGQIKYTNNRLLDLTGYKQEHKSDLFNKDWIEIFAPELHSFIHSTIVQELHNKNSWTGELLIEKNGVKYIELVITKLPDGGIVGTCRDITNQQKADHEKEELQAQFYQAQKMEAIGRLAGGIAHDFNNILAAINGYSEFLIEDLDHMPAQQKFADKIHSATQQAKKLVDQILTFSRRNDSQIESVDLIDLIAENKSMIKASAIGTINVETKVTLDKAMIEANATQISQAIMNLCVNAIDAMEDGHGALSMKISPYDKNYVSKLNMFTDQMPDTKNSPIAKIKSVSEEHTILSSGKILKDYPYVCITIKDTGTGMSRVVMEHVFEPFFTTKPVNKGTGLGLSTVHGVVIQHKGAIVIDSITGKGTSFHLYFPLAKDQTITIRDESKTASHFEYQDIRILLVEDQDEVRDMTAKMLQRMGFTVIEAVDGKQALNILAKQSLERPYHLVITDHSMPNMTGLELALEAESIYPHLPFIVLSGYSEKKLQNIMQNNGSIKAILRKPASSEMLKKQINQILTKSYEGHAINTSHVDVA